MENPVIKRVDPDQMPHYLASDLDLQYMTKTLLRISRLEWVKFCCSSLQLKGLMDFTCNTISKVEMFAFSSA